jgi:hypothetical protein
MIMHIDQGRIAKNAGPEFYDEFGDIPQRPEVGQ